MAPFLQCSPRFCVTARRWKQIPYACTHICKSQLVPSLNRDALCIRASTILYINTDMWNTKSPQSWFHTTIHMYIQHTAGYLCAFIMMHHVPLSYCSLSVSSMPVSTQQFERCTNCLCSLLWCSRDFPQTFRATKVEFGALLVLCHIMCMYVCISLHMCKVRVYISDNWSIYIYIYRLAYIQICTFKRVCITRNEMPAIPLYVIKCI
jgi:hypothetical protein